MRPWVYTGQRVEVPVTWQSRSPGKNMANENFTVVSITDKNFWTVRMIWNLLVVIILHPWEQNVLYIISFPCPNVAFALVASASQVLRGSDENPEFWALPPTSVPFFSPLSTLPCSPYSVQRPFSCYSPIPRGLEAACPSLPLREHSSFLFPTPSTLDLTHSPSCCSQTAISGVLPLYNLRFQPPHYCYIC